MNRYIDMTINRSGFNMANIRMVVFQVTSEIGFLYIIKKISASNVVMPYAETNLKNIISFF